MNSEFIKKTYFSLLDENKWLVDVLKAKNFQIDELKRTGQQETSSLEASIEHTCLKPDATKDEIKRLCEEAERYSFKGVCVNPYYVPYAVSCLKGSNVKVVSVVGFPLGATSDKVKSLEASFCVSEGATEIDMVINLAALKNREFEVVYNDFVNVKRSIGEDNYLKVIIETCLLTDEEKLIASILCVAAGVDCVKTSTGFSTSGADLADINLIRSVIGHHADIKASGGIRDKNTASEFIDAGANWLGTSSSVEIVSN